MKKGKEMNKVIDAILNYVEPDDDIILTSRLKADCALTSFDMVCLVEELNTEFNTTIDNAELKKCATVGDLCGLYNYTPEDAE